MIKTNKNRNVKHVLLKLQKKKENKTKQNTKSTKGIRKIKFHHNFDSKI